VVHEFIIENYAGDEKLKIWFALDYYSFHKIKPKPFVLDEVEKKEKYNWMEEKKLNHHKNRYVVFDLPKGISEMDLPERICIEYTGTTEARLITQE
jgi:hypothetical protein